MEYYMCVCVYVCMRPGVEGKCALPEYEITHVIIFIACLRYD